VFYAEKDSLKHKACYNMLWTRITNSSII